MYKLLFRRGFILPVIVVALLPLGIAWLTQAKSTALSAMIGTGLFMIGVGLVMSTTSMFHMTGGSLAPWNPPRDLVTSGPYRYVRNPMVLGVCLMLVGEAVFLQSRWLGLWCASFLAGQLVYVLFGEEPALRGRYGDRYLRYCSEVPRWLPRLTPAVLRNSPHH